MGCAIAAPIRRHLSVKPILFFCQSTPGGFHSLVALMGRLIVGTFCKLRAVLSVLKKMLGLFHGFLPSDKTRRHRSKINIIEA